MTHDSLGRTVKALMVHNSGAAHLRRAVRTSCGLTCPSCWLPRDTVDTDGFEQGKVDVLNLATRELPSLVTPTISFTFVQTAGAHWMADTVQPFCQPRAVFGTDRLNPKRWAVSAVRLWWRTAEIRLECFSRTAMVTYNWDQAGTLQLYGYGDVQLRSGWNIAAVRLWWRTIEIRLEHCSCTAMVTYCWDQTGTFQPHGYGDVLLRSDWNVSAMRLWWRTTEIRPERPSSAVRQKRLVR